MLTISYLFIFSVVAYALAMPIKRAPEAIGGSLTSGLPFLGFGKPTSNHGIFGAGAPESVQLFSLERAAHGGVRSCSRFMHHVLLHLYANINVFLLKVQYTRNGKFDANHYTVGIDYQ